MFCRLYLLFISWENEEKERNIDCLAIVRCVKIAAKRPFYSSQVHIYILSLSSFYLKRILLCYHWGDDRHTSSPKQFHVARALKNDCLWKIKEFENGFRELSDCWKNTFQCYPEGITDTSFRRFRREAVRYRFEAYTLHIVTVAHSSNPPATK